MRAHSLAFPSSGASEQLQQRVARFRDAAILRVAASGVGMRRLGQFAEGGVDLRRLERSFQRQVQRLTMFQTIVPAHSEKQGAALLSRRDTQLDLIFLPSLARHDQTFAKCDASLRFERVEAEWTDNRIGRREEGVPAAFDNLDPANRRHIENSHRAIPDDPFLAVSHSVISPGHFCCAKASYETARRRLHACSQPKSLDRMTAHRSANQLHNRTWNTLHMNMTAQKTDAQAPGPVPPALKRFIWDIQSMVELADSEREILVIGRDLMARLVASDDWLPEVFSAPDPAGGVQYQLYRDGLERFSVVSVVLPAGSGLLVDRPNLWEIVGVLRGSVSRQIHDPSASRSADETRALQAAEVDTSASRIASAVEVSNALTDQVSISVHVYGGDVTKLNARRIADASDEGRLLGYANSPNAPPYDILTIQTQILD